VFCSQCGAPAGETGKYCSKCGTALTPAAVTSSPVAAKQPSVFWLYLVGVLLVGTYAAVVIPALSGARPAPPGGPGCMLWTGLFFWVWWKRRRRKGWQGALIGAAIGFAVFLMAAAIGGYVHATSPTGN
jgi:hypothetical protein